VYQDLEGGEEAINTTGFDRKSVGDDTAKFKAFAESRLRDSQQAGRDGLVTVGT
jgi:hypothetical protein